MTFGNNIMFSAVVHVTIVTAILALASRDAALRVPEENIMVTLIAHAETVQQVTGGEQKAALAGESIQTAQKKRPKQPVVASSPAPDARESTPVPLPEKRSSAQTSAGPSKDAQAEVRGTIQGDQGRESHKTSSGTVHLAIPGNKADKDSPGAGREVVAENSTWAIGAIRDAIERAKIYPALARRRNQGGTVVTEFSINDKGLPEDVRVTRSSGFSLIDNAARDTVRRAAPFPVVKGSIEVPITFVLK